MKDVQNTPDTRGIAIDQVGVCDLTYPFPSILEQSVPELVEKINVDARNKLIPR